MTKYWTVRLANASDVPPIVDLFKEGFSLHTRSLLIYGCDGASEYLSQQIAQQLNQGESSFFVASAKEIIGYLELRRLKEAACLNYFATKKEHRGKGILSDLIVHALEMAIREGFQRTFLDVFQGNPASAFYEKIGYCHKETSLWYMLDLSPYQKSATFFCSGLTQANALQDKFGFSQFRLTSNHVSYEMGRIGSEWFRSSDPSILNDPEALSALHSLDKGRKLLNIIPATFDPPVGSRLSLLLTSHRMEGQIQEVIRTLLTRKSGNIDDWLNNCHDNN